MTVLFDKKFVCNNKVPPDYAELTQTSQPLLVTVRETLETWFSHYPLVGKTEFLTRLRSGKSAFEGALLELVVHEILRCYGGNVQIEAMIPSCKRPDFHLKTPEGRELWVECTVAQRSTALGGSIKIAKRLQEVVNSLDTAPFGLDWTVLRYLNGAHPSENFLKRHIEEFILDLNERIRGRSIVEGRAVGETQWEDRGWKIRFGAFYLPGYSSSNSTILDDEGESAGVNAENEGWMESDPKKLRIPLEKKASQLRSAIGVEHNCSQPR